jgi:two-component system chemotaxis response regulator CheB
MKQKLACPNLVAIGSSTGGPDALATIFKGLPAHFPVPIVVTQHMPKVFLEKLSKRIADISQLHCSVAKDGEVLKAGHIYFAPGDIHMKITGFGTRLRVCLEDGPRVNHCIPSVDVLFASLAELSPRTKTLALVITGMGDDGAKGAKLLADKHNLVLVQDEQTSTVWGMAGATVRLGVADEELPLEAIARRLMRYTECRA